MNAATLFTLLTVVAALSTGIGWLLRGPINTTTLHDRISQARIEGYRTAQHDIEDLQAENHDLEQRLNLLAGAVTPLPDTGNAA